MNGVVLCVILDFISSRMKAEGDVKEAGLEGAENLRMGFPHWRTGRRLENHLASIHTSAYLMTSSFSSCKHVELIYMNLQSLL